MSLIMDPDMNKTSVNATLITPSGEPNVILDIILYVLLIIVMFSLGCTADDRNLRLNFKRPCGLIIGLCCQFGIMPLSTFLLAFLSKFKPSHAVAIIIVGCCPGGMASNMASYWVDGDMDLSLCMTVTSVLLSVIMMPLNLYIYSIPWTHIGSITIPYKNLGFMLLLVLIPVCVGIFTRRLIAKKAEIIVKVGFIVGTLAMILFFGAAVIDGQMWNISASVICAGFLSPCIGYSLGFLFARLSRQSWTRCRTICLETGIQNTYMCAIFIELSFSGLIQQEMMSYILIYIFASYGVAFLVIKGYIIYSKCFKKHRSQLPVVNVEEVQSYNAHDPLREQSRPGMEE
ncbi:ileal sodium/bile acid cotransporter-like [Polypterus senegalus]|uniref:ileal sodium/bile acid cotransporter-like n=1 Tax=Polypterus senegalus TaxID=55291 RepID=UPI001966696A|nr:ileal sodium/bile acid cotransporter-like [Polypterus senegalus]